MNLAPIVLFVYNRPEKTHQTLLALKNNHLANESHLVVFSDAPKPNGTNEDKLKVEEVRTLVRKQKWPKSIRLIEASENMGLAASVINGVSEVIKEYGKVIVLEDDLITSKFFLKYMNDALHLYENEVEVGTIAAYVPISGLFPMRSTFFQNKITSWGWGTWARVWESAEWDSKKLINQFQQDQKKISAFRMGEVSYYQMLLEQYKGHIDSWAVRFASFCLLNNYKHLYPNQNLIYNIGFGEDATHTKSGKSNKIVSKPVEVKRIKIEPSLRLHKFLVLKGHIRGILKRVFKT